MKMGSAVLGLALALLACAPSRQALAARETGNAAEGLRLAEIHCAQCRAIGPVGESRHPVAPPFRTLSRRYLVNTLDEAFAEGILVGHPDMPNFQFEPSQIDDLLAYLNSVQQQRGG